MRKEFLGVMVALALAAPAGADVLSLPPAAEEAPKIKLPAKGLSMQDMERQFGEPRQKRPTVGGTAPRQPPITRWDYDGYYVIFERNHIVDVVVPGAPPKIHNRDRLEPLSTAATPAPVAAPAPAMPPEAAAPAAPAGEAAPAPSVPADPAAAPATPAEPAAEPLSPQVRETPTPAQ